MSKLFTEPQESMFDKLGDMLRESLDAGFILQEEQSDENQEIPEENSPQSNEEKDEEIEKIKKEKSESANFNKKRDSAKKAFSQNKEFVSGFSENRKTQAENVRRFEFRAFSEAVENGNVRPAQIYRPLKIPENVRAAFVGIGIPENADAEIAKKIYREKLQYYHPDKWIGTQYLEDAEKNTRRLIELWAIAENWFLNKPVL